MAFNDPERSKVANITQNRAEIKPKANPVKGKNPAMRPNSVSFGGGPEGAGMTVK
jgi:hypothetical protein